MSGRLLRHVWKWRQLNGLTQRVHFSAISQAASYATLLNNVSQKEHPQEHQLLQTSLFCRKEKLYYSQAKTQPRENKHSASFLLDKLESQYKLNGYLNYNQFDKLLGAMENSSSDDCNQLLDKEQSLFLLEACGPLMPAQRVAQRLEVFQRLWNYLKENGQITPAHFNTHLLVLQHNRAPLSDFRTFIREIKALDAESCGAELFAEVLATVCSSGNMRQATEVLAEMRAQNLPLTERNFNSLIEGHARNYDIDGCNTVCESMAAAGVPLSTETQTKLVCAYLENGVEAKVHDILSKFHGQFNASQVVMMLRSALFAELNENLVIELVREFPPEFVSSVEVPITLRNLCIELLHNSKLATVLTIMATLPNPTFNENQDIDTFGVFLLHELFRAQIPVERILEIVQMLKHSGKNTRALHIATEVAIRRSPPTGLPLLDALAKEEVLRPHYFWPLIMYNFRRHGESGIMHTLKLMSKDFNVDCDRETLMQYVLPHIFVTLEDPIKALKMFDEVGVKPSQVMEYVIVHLLTMQKLDDVDKLVELYPTKLDLSKLLQPLSSMAVHARAIKRQQQFARVVSSLSKKSENRKTDFVGQLLMYMLSTQPRLRDDLPGVQRLVEEMCKFGLSLAPAAADTIRNQLAESPQQEVLEEIYKILQKMSNRNLSLPSAVESEDDIANAGASTFIKHPREMSLDELECHLIELESKGLNTRGVLRRLLQLCVRDGRLERALEVKAKCDELKVQVSPGMYASIFDMYVKLKDLTNADQTLNMLHKSYPNFQIDEHKIIDYAALLVHTQQLETAKELLQRRASQQKIIGGDYVLKNVWNFLTNVAQFAATTNTLPPETNLTREFFHFMQRLRYCRSHNTVLGPIVREWLLRGDIHSAVAEFCRLAEEYKHTPLQFELLSLLVRLSNAHPDETAKFAITVDEAQQLLAKVTAAVAQVHGGVNMNSALLLAFAESGTENQLRRLLINPEFRINQELLLKNCAHLGMEGSVQTLLRLARGARGLSRVVDEQGIYNMLLAKFAKENNYAAALDLFDRLEADDELKISQEFLRNLVNLLKFNSIEIPSNIALRAQVI